MPNRNFFAFAKNLRLQRFDLTSEDGRTAERYRLALWSILANVLSKGVAMLVMVMSVNLTLPYLGPERFGVWMTIASFVGMLLFLDLGVGNALTNRVAQAATNNSKAELTRVISGGLGILCLIGLASSTLFAILTAYLPWSILIKATSQVVQDEIKRAMFLFSGLFGVNIVSLGVQKVFAGLQRSFEAHASSALSSIASLVLLWLTVGAHVSIPMLIMVTLGCQSVSGLILLIVLKRRGLVLLQNIRSAVQIEKTNMFKLGGLFFALQIGTMVGWGADSLIISSTLGPTEVAVFAIVQRLFQLISAPLAVANSPLWSSYADAHARGDYKFIKNTVKKSVLLTALITIIVGGYLTMNSQYLIETWTNGAILVPKSLVYIFFIWTICETVGNSFAMMMNGCGVMRPQVAAVLIFLVLAIPLKLLFVHQGVQNMLLATVFSYIIAVPIFYMTLFKMKLTNIVKNG